MQENKVDSAGRDLDADFRAFSVSATSLDVGGQKDAESCNGAELATPTIGGDVENKTTIEKIGDNNDKNRIAVSKSRYVTTKDFELLKVIGLGAFGKVLQVRNRKSGDILAMKVISKRLLRKRVSYVQNIQAERDILTKINHPFVVKMHCSFQTSEKLFIIMDFCAGGELFLRLGREGIFLEKTAAFYLAEIILALEHLHSKGVLHRDLKPENILLQSSGHLALTDFGLAKDFSATVYEDDNGDPENRALTICGTGEYMAPEMIAKKGYGKAADFWSLGCIAYEMLSGNPPFHSKNGTKDLFRKILNERVRMPDGASAAACKLLKGLLNRDASKRLGAAKGTMFKVGGVTELKQSDFFSGLDWRLLELKEIDPPQVLTVENDQDLKNFHDEFVKMTIPRSVKEMTKEDFKPNRCASDTFRGFSFIMDDFDLPERQDVEADHYWNNIDADGMSKSSCASSVFNDQEDMKEEPKKKKRPPRKKKKNKDKILTEANSLAHNPTDVIVETEVNDDPTFKSKDEAPATLSIVSNPVISTPAKDEANKDSNSLPKEEPSQISISPKVKPVTHAQPKVVQPQWQSVTKKQRYVPPNQRVGSPAKPYINQTTSYAPITTPSYLSPSKTNVAPSQQRTMTSNSKPPPPGSWAALATTPKKSAVSSLTQTNPRMKQGQMETERYRQSSFPSIKNQTSPEPQAYPVDLNVNQPGVSASTRPKLAVQENYWPSLGSPTKSSTLSNAGNNNAKGPKLQGSWGSKTKPKFANKNAGAWN